MNNDLIIVRHYIKKHVKDAAEALADLSPEILADFFKDSPNDLLLEIIPQMDPYLMAEVYGMMDLENVAHLFESMEIHHAVLSIRIMSDNFAASVLNMLSEEKSNSLRKLLQYPDHSVGSHMDPAVFTLEENQTVKDAIAVVRKLKKSIQPQLFVLSAERKLMGILSVSDLITGSPGKALKSIMNTGMTALSPETPIQSLLSHPEWESLYALPVVDNSSSFLGAITLESIRSIQVKSAFRGEESGQAAVRALGELYRLGLSGLYRSAADLETLSEK